jgi:hypothetical protein
MDTSTNITAAVFEAYLNCPTKGYLLARGDKPSNSFFADMRGSLSVAYKANVESIVSVDFLKLAGSGHNNKFVTFVDSRTAFFPLDQSASVRSGCQTKGAEPYPDYIPVLYSAWDKLEPSDNLLVVFGALTIRQVVGSDTNGG